MKRALPILVLIAVVAGLCLLNREPEGRATPGLPVEVGGGGGTSSQAAFDPVAKRPDPESALEASTCSKPLEWQLTPIAVGPGTVLFLEGRVWSDGFPSMSEHALVDPLRGPPRIFLRHQTSMHALGRIGPHLLLMVPDATEACRHDIVDLPRGIHRALLGGRHCRLVEIVSGTIFVTVEDGPGLVAVRPETPDDGRVLLDSTPLRILAIGRDDFFVLLRSSPRGLWRVPKWYGTATLVTELGSLNGFTEDWEVSPGGARIVASGTDTVTVIDVKTGGRSKPFRDTPVSALLEGSADSMLEFVWVDDRVLRYSETETPTEADDDLGWLRWVDIDVVTGERLAERRYAPLGLKNLKPPPDLQGFEGGDYEAHLRSLAAATWPVGEVTGEWQPARPFKTSPGRVYVALSGDNNYTAIQPKGGKELWILAGRGMRRVADERWSTFYFLDGAR